MFYQRFPYLRNIVLYMGKITSFFFPIRFTRIISDYLNLFYSGRIIRGFKRCGVHFYAKRHITIFHPENIEIGNDVYIYKDAILATHSMNSKMIIGDGVLIGEGCHLTCINEITINNDVLMGRRVIITDNSHGEIDFCNMTIPPLDRKVTSKGGVIIGRNVWLGDNVIVLPGVEIGEGSVIGAASVVTKNIPPYSVGVGNPCRVIKKLFPNKSVL